ncbi:HlyD family secretion protein [Enterobacter hormaechei]|uniref:HlyD family secretion protein n=1 Tax=Enterobacter cloacae complex TaxID=354276 RepID=UPI000F81676E|nr:HlyD family efflux transporter periplasmic adaptor subunit [Enterobacter hormaechei]EJK8584508.1 HlyD family efflux transporter periplasmic adaptor subunit [Enterobacter hormaechei]EKT9836695.1 HlyD family efflux transporter periplasmic adaptor subunit [Enterobacter hormaechei]EKX4901465.1 HlyD family efflux transporter periplasmic adaptor subunit [Enterobacter hormaechei]ELD2090589.1 HlyD family efflux transporter periplasmic adaptor subunit [Enterobacter hormaechei]ELD3413008.1 HlyD famil
MKLKNRSGQRRALIPHHFSKSYHINAPRLKAVLTLFIAFFLCLLVFAIVFNFSETTLARGVLIPAQGDVEVRARESGTLVDFAVRPGQYVKENDPLFTVSQDYGGKQGSVVQFDRQQMEAEKKRSEQRIQAIEDSIASYRKNLAQQLALTDKQIAVSRDKVKKLRALLKNSTDTYEAWKSVSGKGYVSRVDLDKSHNDVLNAQLNLTLEESTILELEARKTSLTDSTQSQIDSLSEEQLYVKNRISEIDRNLSSRGSSTMAMLAPSDGYVVAINFPPGRAITQNSEVVVVIRKNTAATMEGYLYVPATGVGRVAKGDKVKLRFDSWPVDKYGSVETTLSDFYEVNIDAHSALIPLQEGQNYYLAKVRVPSWFTDPDKKKRMLMGGMTVNADIVIDRKPLINLLIAPLERVRKRFID